MCLSAVESVMHCLCDTMKYIRLRLVILLSSYVVLTITTCRGPSTRICLAPSQINSVTDNATLISDIKENYYRNESFYSTLPPIVELSESQKSDILERYPEFFRATPQAVLEEYVYNGTVYRSNRLGRRRRQVSADYVCPATDVYEDIQFSFSAEGNLLQMVQLLPGSDGACDLPACLGIIDSISITLNQQQRNAIAGNQETIRQLTETCSNEFDHCDESKSPIIEFTELQKSLILAKYGYFFSEVPPIFIPDLDSDSSEEEDEEEGEQEEEEEEEDDRRKRSLIADYVCSIEQEYEDVNFAVNGEGHLLQLVEIGNNTNQWILSEGCDSSEGPNVEDVICFERKRSISALVVNLVTEDIAVEDITVACCTAGYFP